jgi:hypothetical protein
LNIAIVVYLINNNIYGNCGTAAVAVAKPSGIFNRIGNILIPIAIEI